MSDSMRELYRDILDIKKRLARLEAQDSFEFEPWTVWTPEVYGATTAGNITYSFQNGAYLKIDALVFIHGRVTISAITVAPAGALRIRTLPFATTNNASNPPIMIQGGLNLTAGYTQLSGNFPANSTFISVTEVGDNVLQNFPSASLVAGDDIRFAGFYPIP